MNEDELLDLVNRKIGYQAYVLIEKKPLPQPQRTANPFVDPTIKTADLWMVRYAEIGLDTPFGPAIVGKGQACDLAWADAVKSHPNLGQD